MRSIKPGRGPSAVGALGGVGAAIFGVIWIFFAASIGAPPIFCLFGVVFVLFAIVGSVFNFKNATGKNRMSMYDITDENEEPDPLQTKFHSYEENHIFENEVNNSQTGINFCPYCRYELKSKFKFCPNCGKDITDI